MSAKSWADDFYPTEAKKLVSKSDIEVINHSIRKWEGALPKNLKLHNLAKPPIYFGTETCSLCQKYYANNDEYAESLCDSCPIYNIRGAACFEELDKEEISPYHAYTINNNPSPMLKVLEATRKYCIKAVVDG